MVREKDLTLIYLLAERQKRKTRKKKKPEGIRSLRRDAEKERGASLGSLPLGKRSVKTFKRGVSEKKENGRKKKKKKNTEGGGIEKTRDLPATIINLAGGFPPDEGRGGKT